MATIFQLPKTVPVSGGNSYSACKLYFYQSGTTTAITTYTTAALSVPHANPVVADANGVFAPIFIDETTNPTYKLRLNTSTDVLIYEVDNLIASQGTARTAAEIAASVTVVNDSYDPGVIDRYGTNTTPGTTDMTAAVQAAIDQAEAGGASVFIPPRTYAVTALTVDSANGITITGDGYNSVLKGASAGTQIIILLQRTGYTAMSGVRLSNFRVDGNSGGQLDAGLIQANNCVGFVFDRLWVENGTRVSGSQGVNGIACSAGSAGATGSLGSITNCYLRNMSKAAINWTSESVSAYIAGNVIRDCTGNGTTPGIQLNGGFNGKVIGNHVTNCQGPGIYVAVDGSNNPSRNAVIANNTVHACGATSTTLADGILIANAGGTPTGRFVVANNQSYDNGNATGGGAGIYIQNDDNMVVTGNLCRNNYYDGIRVLNCNHVTISGNRCTGNDVAAVNAGGIHIRGTCAHMSITTNHCSDDKGSPTQNYGIILDSAAVLTYLTIADNHLQGNVSGPLLADATAKPARISLLGELQTTDATVTTIQYFIIPDDSAAHVKAGFVAKKTDGSNRALYSREGLFYRDGGAGTQQGATTTLGTDIESDATWGGITMDASGNGARIRAAGLAATTIDWRGSIEVTIV